MARDVFLSVGATYTDEQERFVEAVEQALRHEGLNPRSLGRNEWSSEQPLRAIRKMMDTCDGAVVVAFERVRIANGHEKPGSKAQKALTDCALPTVWNQIEAAMAHTLGKPLLVVCAGPLKSEGLLEVGYDWYVQNVELDAETTKTRDFRGILEDWKNKVLVARPGAESGAAKREPLEPEKMSLSQLIGSLKVSHLVATIATACTVLGAVAAGAFWAGQHLRDVTASAQGHAPADPGESGAHH